jgi:hypothetical protein
MDDATKKMLEPLHKRHEDKATYYEITSVLKPDKAESLKPEDRIYRKACNICGFPVERESKPWTKEELND